MNTKILKSTITEYGPKWTINRGLYSAKLKMMSSAPFTEKLFERNITIKKIDLFDFDIATIKKFCLNLPKDEKQKIINDANNAIEGKLLAFSSLELDYGNPINWHYNPITKAETPATLKWYKIKDFDEKIGDIKVIWEASRFTHFYSFLRAFLITNDKKYYKAFSSQLDDWLKNNLYPYGANFKCGQECSLRMVNTLMAFNVFKKFDLPTMQDEKNVIKLVELCYKKVTSNFFYAHKCIQNNHTFSEICGLIVGAWCSNDSKRLKEAYILMDKEIVKQFNDDGGFTQYSFNYHRFTLQILEMVMKISNKVNIQLQEKQRVKKSVLLLHQVLNQDGDVPNYGSNDGAHIFPMSSCGYRDFRPVLNTVYSLIEGKKLYGNGIHNEEMLWFTCSDKYPIENVEKSSTAYNDTGFYTISHNEGFIFTCLQSYKSRPAHMDQLHVDLWHKGNNLLCDSGTYSYASSLGKELVSTSGHNTVKLSGKEQMNKVGPFLISDWTLRKNTNHTKSSFKGTMVSKNGYTHSREIISTENGFKIFDHVNGDSDFCELYFHSPCRLERTKAGVAFYDQEILISEMKIQEEFEITKSERSLYYLKAETINCVIVKVPMNNQYCETKIEINLH